MYKYFCCGLRFWCILDTLVHLVVMKFGPKHDWIVEEADKSTLVRKICDKHDEMIGGHDG